jgi:hypothetical protein
MEASKQEVSTSNVLCLYFLKGTCTYGLNCRFSHDLSLLTDPETVLPKQIKLYKTEMCRAFTEVGYCKYGDRCQFAHGIEELRQINRHKKYKTKKCKRFHEEGVCPFGNRCCFIHNESDSAVQTPVPEKTPSSTALSQEVSTSKRFKYSEQESEPLVLNDFTSDVITSQEHLLDHSKWNTVFEPLPQTKLKGLDGISPILGHSKWGFAAKDEDDAWKAQTNDLEKDLESEFQHLIFKLDD